MSKETQKFERPVPEVIARHGDIKKLFLQPGYNEQEFQKTLRFIYDVSSEFFKYYSPGYSDTVVLPRVSSKKLLELGIVSDEAGRSISHRTSNANAADFNTIEIERLKTEQGTAYKLTEYYTNREGVHILTDQQGNTSEVLLDSADQEVTTIEQIGGKFVVDIQRLATSKHIHALGRRWEPTSQEEEERKINEARSINATVALISEALAPGIYQVD